MIAVWIAVDIARPIEWPIWPTALIRAPPRAWPSYSSDLNTNRVSEGQAVSTPKTDNTIASRL